MPVLPASFWRSATIFGVGAACFVSAGSSSFDSPEVGVPGLYKGLVAWAFAWAFLDAYSIGCNDIANAFSNAVASGTVTHKKACLIACVFELIGVIGLGAGVTDTIRTKMTDVKLFQHDPYVLALGMSFVNLGSGLWVIIATSMSMPVSTTHAVVGAVMGIGIAAWGPSGVLWSYEGGGFARVVSSWFISPVASGSLAALFYVCTKYFILVLPTEQAIRRTLMFMPFYMFFVFGVIYAFLFMKGIPVLNDTPLSVTLPVAFGIGVFHMIWGFVCVVPWLRRTVVERENLPWYTIFFTPCVGKREQESGISRELALVETTNSEARDAQQVPEHVLQTQKTLLQLGEILAPGLHLDVKSFDAQYAAMHAKSFHSDEIVEDMFKVLQLSSCCFFSLAHGANDVANAIGPFSSVWAIYRSGVVDVWTEVPLWILIYGGLCLDVGLLTYGHKMMLTLGNRLTLQTPSRGFCIELAAMFNVMVASKTGIPVSTTHCITGATVGVGLCNGNTGAVNGSLIMLIFFGWIVTCPCAGLLSGMFFWASASAPRAVAQNNLFASADGPWSTVTSFILENRTAIAEEYQFPYTEGNQCSMIIDSATQQATGMWNCSTTTWPGV